MLLNSLGTMEHFNCFLLNSLGFLLCSGVRYFFSSLVKDLTILVMKFWSLLFLVVAAFLLLSSVVLDIREAHGDKSTVLVSCGSVVKVLIDSSMEWRP